MDFVQIASQFGIPAVILVALGLAIRQVIVFVGTRIAEPLTQGALENYKVQNACTEKMADTLEAIGANTARIAARQSDIVLLQKQIIEKQATVVCKADHFKPTDGRPG